MKKTLCMVLAICLIVNLAIFIGAPEPVWAGTIGNVNMDGDSTINGDDFADSSSTQYRWLSYPGSRFALNANQTTDSKVPAGAMDSKLSIGVGGWWGSTTKNFNEILRTQAAVRGGNPGTGTSVVTTWYPYKINYSASFSTPTGTTVSGYDMMLDANSTLLRVVEITASSANDVVLTGKITASGGGQWIGGTDKVVLVTDSNYYYAIHVVSLSGDNLTPVELNEIATVNGSEWTFRKPFDGNGRMAVSIGFATSGEGSTTAISRAKNVFSQNVSTTVANLKSYTDGLLRDVPAPANWGISGIDAHGVTSAQHKAMYYSSWAFVFQSLTNSLPENSGTYPYPQVMCGKPSLWNYGDTANPGTSQWESVFGYQMLSFVMPETAWQAYLGLLTRVDSEGMIGGESLPTRIAQTAWILYQNSSNFTYLSNAYTDIKRHLLWAADNPRWIYSAHNIPEEKDFNFISSYMFDVEFAIKIATELGITADVAMWQSEKAAAIANLDDWFFKDPDIIYGLFYDYTLIPKEWVPGNDMFRTTALVIDDLTVYQRSQLNSSFMSIHRPDNPGDNFAYHKYPDATLILEGLIEHGGHVQAAEFAKACLRDTIRAKECGEAIVATGKGTSEGGVRIESVVPSLFTAVEAIHLTWLINNLRFDHDVPTLFTFNSSSLTVPDNPDAMPAIEDFKDISDWTNTYNSYMTAVGGSGVFRYVQIENAPYGVLDKQVTYNVDDFPLLTVKMKQVFKNAQWALKVNDGGTDIQLQGETSQTGEITYNLKGITNWSGTKTFTIRVYVLGGDVWISGINALNYVLEEFNSVSDWTCPENATISAASGIGTVTTTSTYGYAKKSVAYNVDEYRKLKIKISELGTGSQWALKVNDGGTDIALETGSSATGEFVFDLKTITGWSGMKTFDIKLFAVGGSGKYVKTDYIVLSFYVIENFNVASDWNQISNASITAVSGIATVTCGNSTYGSVARKISIDVSRYIKLSLKVTEVGAGAQWALKVNDGSGDVTLQANTTSTGDFTYNLASVTGWSGQKSFNILLYVTGGSGKYFKADEVRISDN